MIWDQFLDDWEGISLYLMSTIFKVFCSDDFNRYHIQLPKKSIRNTLHARFTYHALSPVSLKSIKLTYLTGLLESAF